MLSFMHNSYAQVGASVNFNDATTLPAGWTNPTGFFTVLNTAACQGNSIRTNLWGSTSTSSFLSPNYVAGSNGTDVTFSFDYKVVEYAPTSTATPAGWGSLFVETSSDNGTTWVITYTINNANHVVASTCANVTFVIPGADVPSGSNLKFRFRGLRTTGDYFIYLDNISFAQETSLPPNCDATLVTPANGAINANLSGNVSWIAATGVPSGYSLTVGTTAGGSDVLPLTDVGNVTSKNIGVLLASTTYYVSIVPYNLNGDATGCTEYSFTTFTPPTNDNCSGAIALTVNPALACSAVTSGTVLGATASPTSTTSCSGSEDDDVWFSFVATDTRHKLTLSDILGSTTYMEHSVWQGANCNSLTLVPGTCSTENSTVVSNLVIGTTYYFRVYTNTATLSQDTTFKVCVGTLPTPIIGSLCANPIIVTLPYNTTNDTTNYEDINYEGSPGATGCGTTYAYLGGNDVVYAYTPTTTTSIKIKLTTPATWVGFFVYNSCAAIGTGCIAGGVNGPTGGSINILDLPVTAGQTYYFVVSTYPDPQTAAYTLNILENTCTNATATYAVISDCLNGPQFFVNVNITSLGTANSLTISNNQLSSPQNVSTTGIANFGPFLNGTPVIFTIKNDQDLNCVVISDAKTQVACPATNDECSAAISLTVNPDLNCASTNLTAGNVIGATASAVSATSCGGSEDDDVWFSFVATETSHFINLLDIAGSQLDLFHSLWTGPDCNNLTLVPGTCSDPNRSNPSGLTVGETYYLRVYTTAAILGQTTTFNVCIGTTPPPPVNDTCDAALTLSVGTSFAQNAVVGSTAGALTTTGLTAPAIACVAATSIINEVWYSVTPLSTTMTVETSTVAGTLLTDTVVRAFTGTCGALVSIGCNDDIGGGNFFSKVALTGLTIGTPIYIGVWKYLNTFVPGMDGQFKISAYDASLANNTFESASFSAYPNPVTDILNLSYSKNIDKLQVMNLLGQEVLTKSVNATNVKVDMSNLASGTYLVKVTSDNLVKTLKVVKQ